MATKQSTVDYVLDQLSPLADVSARKMFGEYAVYLKGKVVALVCNNKLFVKITEPGKMFVGEQYVEGCAYPGAKPSIQISPDQTDDSAWLCELVEITAENLPISTKKTKKKISTT